VAFVLWNGTNLAKVKKRFLCMFVLGNLRRSVVLGKIEEQGIVKRWVRFGGAAYQI